MISLGQFHSIAIKDDTALDILFHRRWRADARRNADAYHISEQVKSYLLLRF